jgi:hypothetical protein
MAAMWSDAVLWNIFARELEWVLQAHNLRLGHLDDRKIVLHPEKVRRLQQSLKTPTHFPVLNPDELERLNAILSLTAEEQSRLRAAVVATAAERILMDRLDPQTALMAANDVFEICLAAIQEQPASALATAVKAGDSIPALEMAEVEVEDVVDLLDTGAFALDGAKSGASRLLRQRQARIAQALFARAVALLDTERDESGPNEAWSSRMDEACEGHTLAKTLLHQSEAG